MAQQTDESSGLQIERLERRLAEVEARLQDREAQLHDRTRDFKLSSRRQETTQARLEQVEKERDDLLAQIAELEAELEVPRRTDAAAHREVDRLKDDLLVARRDRDQLEARLEEAVSDLARRERSVEKLQVELDQQREQQSADRQLEGQLRASEEQIVELEGELQRLAERNRELEIEHSQAMDAVTPGAEPTAEELEALKDTAEFDTDVIEGEARSTEQEEASPAPAGASKIRLRPRTESGSPPVEKEASDEASGEAGEAPEVEDVTAAIPGPTLALGDVAGEAEFRDLVSEGARFVLSDRFGKIELVSRDDIKVSDWLRSATDLEELSEAARGQLDESRLLDVLWVFFEREMFQLAR